MYIIFNILLNMLEYVNKDIHFSSILLLNA